MPPKKQAGESVRVARIAQWNPRHLIASDRAWERERAALRREIDTLGELRGTLRQGAPAVLVCLDRFFAVQKRLGRWRCYAERRHDEDTRVARYQAMREIAEKLGADFDEATAFVEPELTALPVRELRRLIADPTLVSYDRFLGDILRRKPHILSDAEEALLARASVMRDAAHSAYAVLCAADLTFPEIVDERGRKVRLTQSLFPKYRSSADRSVRKAAFAAYFGTFARYRHTFATLLSSQINANIVFARSRRYATALEAALDPDELSVDVYQQMVTAVNGHLPRLHRYLRLRGRLLGLRRQHYHDLYVPIVPRVRLRYPYTVARELLAESAKPLGEPYVKALRRGLAPESGWLDLDPAPGKRSGAYMDGSAYDVHPYVLGNYLGDYDSLSTVAHEMGHAMHSHFTNSRQPYAKSDYSIFLAEVASTLNEALLAAHLLTVERNPKRRLFLLGEQLDGFRTTIFRQALFAELELELYQRAEAGEALTADLMSERYLALTRRYYGHDSSLIRVDDVCGIEWACIPHFHYNFYVFQYATGMTAATALAAMMLRDGEAARERYFEYLLSAGCSDAPLRLLRGAGVDLTTTRPYDVAMGVFDSLLDQAEELIERGL